MTELFLNRPFLVKVVGNVASREFHEVRLYVQKECKRRPDKFCDPVIKPLLEIDWVAYLSAERLRLGAAAWRIRRPVILYVNDNVLVDDLALAVRCGKVQEIVDQEDLENEMKTFYEDYIFSFERTVVYMDVSLDKKHLGRMLFMLYSDKLPRTCENFLSLCSGVRKEEEKHEGEEDGGERENEKEWEGEEGIKEELEKRTEEEEKQGEAGMPIIAEEEDGGSGPEGRDEERGEEEGRGEKEGRREEEGGLSEGLGEKAEGGRHEMCYKGSSIHRVVKGGWIQGGVIEPEDGKPPSTFPDESFCIPYDRRGILAMVQDSHHTNSTQFMVTLQPTPWMRCRYVAFGQLIEGLEVLDAIENVDTYMESPLKSIVISECGALERPQKPVPEFENEKERGDDTFPTQSFVRSIVAEILSSQIASYKSLSSVRSIDVLEFGNPSPETKDADSVDEKSENAADNGPEVVKEGGTSNIGEEVEYIKVEENEGEKSEGASDGKPEEV